MTRREILQATAVANICFTLGYVLGAAPDAPGATVPDHMVAALFVGCAFSVGFVGLVKLLPVLFTKPDIRCDWCQEECSLQFFRFRRVLPDEALAAEPDVMCPSCYKKGEFGPQRLHRVQYGSRHH